MYYIVYGILWLISMLPLRLLYVLSDFFYCLIFYVFKYRRDVTISNLTIAFPEKTEKEIKLIAKKFYHNLIDTFIETIKMISASNKFILKRFTGNWDKINSFKPSGKSVQIHMGHHFNWEWGIIAGPAYIQFPYMGVYMPLKSKIFDRIFIKLRSRTGATLLRATHMAEDFYPYKNIQYVLCLMADQNPGHSENAWWLDFFGRPTPFIKGPAKAAIRNNTDVVFAFIHKPSRGYYETVISIVEETAEGKTEEGLTKKFANYLENVIRRYPDMWLWSHRRWKLEWKPEYGDLI